MTDQNSQDNDSGVRQRAIEAYDGAGRKANDAIEDAPLIALAGGLALGAILAAILPRTETETRALRPVGDKLAGTARAAAEAAREAGTSRLAELGLTREKGAETLRSIFEGASDAAKVSAKAAVGAARTGE
jgi:hypothetical protein